MLYRRGSDEHTRKSDQFASTVHRAFATNIVITFAFSTHYPIRLTTTMWISYNSQHPPPLHTLFHRMSVLCALSTYSRIVYYYVCVWVQGATAAAKRFEFLQRGASMCVCVCVCVCDINIIHAERGVCCISIIIIIIIIIMIYTEDDETFLMACLDDKVISDLTRCEPFICTPRATIYVYIRYTYT